MIKFWIKTLGCKVNQVESAYIHEELCRQGLFLAERENEAKIFILNSCAVTEGAFKETKKILRHWAKLNPLAIILTGCSAQAFAEEFKKLAFELKLPHFLILGQDQKYKIPQYLNSLVEGVFIEITSSFENCYPFLLQHFHGHSRAFVKIQDGCSSFCSYCIVPYTRGPARSLPKEHILEQIKLFLEQGYEEIVLTGIHIGMWGEDLKPRQAFTDLLWAIETLMNSYGKPLHLRLTSLEVKEIDEDFLAFAKQSEFLCPHFHIPLQSGSNTILRAMNRKYRAEEYLERLSQLASLFPEATFGADVIVGFPGEGDKEFQETYELIEKSPLNWLHVFPFSPRPGTPAAHMEPKVSKSQIKERLKLLKDLHQRKRENFLKNSLGKIRKTVIEEIEPRPTGLTDNYIPVELTTKDGAVLKKGKIVPLKLIKLRGNLVEAESPESKEIVKT